MSWLLLLACGPRLAELEEGEWLPADEATNTVLLGSNAFLMPAPNLAPDDEADFYSGNSFFNQVWVEAPASTSARDGLGPLFNATSCSGCHFRDGRAAPPDGSGSVGALVRVSAPGGGHGLPPVPDTTYGGQIQDAALPDVPGEATVVVEWEEFTDSFGYSLRRPRLSLENPGYGELPADLETSLRVGPATIGLGLLEAIPEAAILAAADPYDVDLDGISGRANRVEGGQLGRFGWKAEQPTVESQTAGAFAGDMGITSTLVPADDCTEAQPECAETEDGGVPEAADDTFARVVLYSRAVAVPVRREWESETVLRGKLLFEEATCVSCHVRSWVTGTAAFSEFEGLLIWPFTDLLLHDLGEDLSDNRPTWNAEGNEWRTAPLWGVGLYPEVSGHQFLMHDGRARGVEEAILWHGGEGAAAREMWASLDAEDRAALVAYVNSL